MKQIAHAWTRYWPLVLTVVILVFVPFHAFLTVWAADLGANYTAARLWKEVLLVVLVAGTGWLLLKKPELRKGLAEHAVVRRCTLLIAAYVALHVLLGGVAFMRGDVNALALGYAFVSNLRFLAFFLVCVVVGSLYSEWITRYWRRLLLIPAALVVGFGLLQEFVLPYDFLTIFGYSAETIQPYIAVDEKLEYARLQSALRGPNPLGAYLVIVLTAVVGLFLARRVQYAKWAVASLATIIVLFGTYSRSAWIGAAVAIGVLAWGLVSSARFRRILLVIAAVALMVGAGLVYALRDHDTVQNVLFHTDETSQSVTSSNEDRAGALTSGFSDIVSEPFGRGPGTAGPASVHNDAPGRISENYFIQIGQEVGVIGLAIFVAINVFVGLALWRAYPGSLLALILAASLVGLTAVNMFSHAWADDTLAYIWWGFAGLALAPASLPTSKAGSPAGLLAPSTFFSSSAHSPYRLYGSLRASLRKRTGHSSAKPSHNTDKRKVNDKKAAK